MAKDMATTTSEIWDELGGRETARSHDPNITVFNMTSVNPEEIYDSLETNHRQVCLPGYEFVYRICICISPVTHGIYFSLAGYMLEQQDAFYRLARDKTLNLYTNG